MTAFYDRLGSPEPIGPDPKSPATDPEPPRGIWRIQRGGVGPGKRAKDANPTKPDKPRMEANVRLW